MKTLLEISVNGFDDEDETPVIRVFDNNESYLIFERFPPENDKLSEYQVDNLAEILSELAGVKVSQDDRELFIIESNDLAVIDKIVKYLIKL